MISLVYRALLRTIVMIASFVPQHKRRIVFCSYGGKGVGSDPGVIATYLAHRYNDLDIVWMLVNLSSQVPAGIRKAKIVDWSKSIFGQIFTLLRSSAMFSSAQVVVCDSKGNQFRKNKNSLYIQTWHGDLPFKFIEGECVDALGKEHERISAVDSQQTDVVLSGSSFMSEIFRKFFWLPAKCKILEVGLPRDDIYFSPGLEVRKKVCATLEFSAQTHIAVYAPTFRDNGDVGVYNSIDFKQVIDSLTKRFSGTWKIVVRLHPNVDSGKVLIHYDENVINASDYPCGEELFAAADLLISDASSVVKEFMMMRKPIFIFFPDYAEYSQTCRALRPLFFQLPFRRCGSMRALVEEISNFNQEVASAQINEFLSRNNIRFFDDGHATERIADLIVKYIRGESL